MYKYTFNGETEKNGYISDLNIQCASNQFTISFSECAKNPKLKWNGRRLSLSYFYLFGVMVTDSSLYTGKDEEESYTCLGLTFEPNTNPGMSFDSECSKQDFCKECGITGAEFRELYTTVVQVLIGRNFGECDLCV